MQTLGGYSAIWLATENPKMQITSIEFDPYNAKVARQNIEAAGVSKQIEVIVGAGIDVLPKLYEDIQTGEREKFGFSFIDADKLNNWNYFDWAVKMSVSRACIVVDNVVSKGKLADPDMVKAIDLVNGERKEAEKVWEEEKVDYLVNMVKGAREVVEKVGKDDRVDGCVLQTVGEKDYDG